MDKKDTREAGMPDLPKEICEPILSQSTEMEHLELILAYQDLEGRHELRTCYGDILKIINALMDYTRMLDEVCVMWNLEGYQRAVYEYHAEKLREIAKKFQEAIGYDYDAAVERCRKKQKKKTSESDVGEDGLMLALKKSNRSAKTEKSDKEKKVEQSDLIILQNDIFENSLFRHRAGSIVM